MNDRAPCGLGEQDDKGLLPIGHEAWMDIGFQEEAAFERALIEKFDALVFDVEAAADFAQLVQKGDHVLMLCAFDKDFPFRADGSHAKRGGFDAIGEDRVFDFVKIAWSVECGSCGRHRER